MGQMKLACDGAQQRQAIILDKSRFCSSKVPLISIKDYLKRIHHYFQCSDECIVLAFVYLDRLNKKDPAMVCELTKHRLLFLAMMLATKVHMDAWYADSYYAKVGGVPVKEVNALELEFLKMLDWRTFVCPEKYQQTLDISTSAGTSSDSE